ncbi:MAG: hypothetical protein OXE96_02475 [Gemmatimonadetes bacterium]|nr:hypothetical protein [Gemmatimonadota bacterium]
MEWEFIAPMIVSVVLIFTVGGVILLRPIAKRLGALLDVMVLEKSRTTSEDHRRLGDGIDTINERLSLIEERQDFTERLIGRSGSGESENG